MRTITNGIQNLTAVGLKFAPLSVREWYKQTFEMFFWRKHLFRFKKFTHAHMKRSFTEAFGLDIQFYDNKDVLDIGCGPVGSLEWADNCKSRTGIDPLADNYVKLNGGRQKMTYVSAGAEKIPFPDQSFDVVSTFNALDHVENVEKAVSEAVRVTRVNGHLLLIVEIDHKATITEPHTLREDILDQFVGCQVEFKRVYRTRDDHNMYASVADAVERTNENEPGIIVAKLKKHR